MSVLISSAEWVADFPRRMALPLSHPDHPLGFEYDSKHKGWSIWWGGYEYFIEDSRLQTKDHLLDWVAHLCGKEWVNPYGITLFIRAVFEHHGWPQPHL